MRTIPKVLVAVLLLLSPTSVQAQDERTALSEYRADLMNALSGHNSGIRAILGGDVERPQDIVLQARGLDGIAEMLLTVWPEGSGGEGTRASTAIWQNGDDFMQRIAALRDAAAQLRDRAEAGDTEGVTAAVREVSQSCRACHSEYRTQGG